MNSLRLQPDPLQWILNILLLVVIASIWTLPTLINAFPLSYYDTAYYLFNAKNLSSPTLIGWRPLTYSYFISPLFTYLGPNAIIFAQNFLLAAGLFYFNSSIKLKVTRLYFFFCSLFLSLTPFVLTSNFIMPDIFTGLTLLFLISFLYGRTEWRWTSLALCLLFSLMHYSNLLIVIPTLLLLHPIFQNRKIGFAALGLLTLVLFRMAFFYPQKNIERTGHIFLFSRLTHYQITNDYYNLNCPQEGNMFCEDRGIIFDLWGNYSSGSNKNKISKAELLPTIIMTNQAIMKSALFPYYIFLSLKQTALQMIHFYRPMDFVLKDKLLNYYYMSYGYLGLFEHQKFFNDKTIDLSYLMAGFSLLFFLSGCLSFLSAGLLYAQNLLPPSLDGALKIFISGYFFNCLSVGFLSEPSGRYNTRMVWVVTWIALLGFDQWRRRIKISKVVMK